MAEHHELCSRRHFAVNVTGPVVLFEDDDALDAFGHRDS